MSNIQKHTHTPRELPQLEELYSDVELAGKHNDLNKLLNCQPKPEWIKQNKFANNSNYMPVAIVEYLLTSIFIKWRVEVKEIAVMANSVVATVRLHVLDPITGEWDWQDGVGASPIQTAKGASATDFSQVNTSAVQMAAPAAETYAFKDAAEKFGRLFGKDLNRNEMVNYSDMLFSKLQKQDKTEIPDELKAVIEEADKENLSNIYKNNPDLHSNPEFMKLLNARKTELNASRNNQPAGAH
jgi:hypothetical protein